MFSIHRFAERNVYHLHLWAQQASVLDLIATGGILRHEYCDVAAGVKHE